ncbi:MAG: hypothetical protein WCB32_19455 [Pseudolabrys sp.]
MSSLKQIEANRLNALKSTGPRTEEGKRSSRCNAIRHGLTAETVISDLEDRHDYEAFEAAVISDYDAESAVERELVLRLASVLWRLRRATGIETALFEFVMRQSRRSMSRAAAKAPNLSIFLEQLDGSEGPERSGANTNKIAEIFLRLSDLPTCPMDRLSRYEHRLWRQARQIVLTLKTSRRGTHIHKGADQAVSVRRSGPFFLR